MREPLADHTTLRLGGPANSFITHTDPADWADIARAACEPKQPRLILGGGSNIIATDAGFPGMVVRMATRGITARALQQGQVEVTVEAGEPLSSLVDFALTEGLSGVEYLVGIPGTTGAAPIQNTGAYGQQISDTLTSITAYDWSTHRIVRIPASECGFGYRISSFKRHPGRFTILTTTLHLRRASQAAPVTYQLLADVLNVPLGTRPPLAEAAVAVATDRQARGLTLPSSGPDARQVGSVFLNPTVNEHQAAHVRAYGGPLHYDARGEARVSAGWLLQHVGYAPGCRLAEGIYCSTQRTLTVVARGSVTSENYLGILYRLSREVEQATGIQMHLEPTTRTRKRPAAR
ncbi:UDP-N-acetylmuramate dehydrogenase [Streptacidiphilus albus]|uniref:UDP-N-acetylmuramate dehydrogenase n=1 Tax=Streptacidiphilus albus TaxID=105425 RepID=UPI0005A683C5|nr:UDP-N-acetylmuramate dehydrogenase [Streptacidiphilus albus]